MRQPSRPPRHRPVETGATCQTVDILAPAFQSLPIFENE
jgi:hypothetical protein